ncbi:hypothetical protein O181_067979 [Austropuccinia psidii MF-1]|uniref:Tf2-1-like SH3-like domain-containing protein n=1 Tax=Austropuccinia psidii MF-1 TaxID=1389203 RepID=A0A9Q3I741_9BASI|nr:hypothetical protein [Austropuccinia psidii MF-1]
MACLQELLVIEVHFLFLPFGPIFVRSSILQEICQLLTIQKLMDRQEGKSDTRTVPLDLYPQFDSVHITQDTPSGKLSTKIQSLQKDVKREHEVSINRFRRYTDKSRASPPVFNPGNMVWLSSKNIKSTRPAKSLSEIWLAPFQILNKISTHAYHLKLSSTQFSTFPSLNQSRHQQSQINIKSHLLQ